MALRPTRRGQTVLALLAAAVAAGAAALLCNPEGSDAGAGDTQVVAVLEGQASFYGPGMRGGVTASGEPFDPDAFAAAHPDLPFGTRLRVTNLDTGAQAVVRVNDRGPSAASLLLDVTPAAAQALDMREAGVVPVRVEVLSRR